MSIFQRVSLTGKPGVLAILADSERKLVVRNDDPGHSIEPVAVFLIFGWFGINHEHLCGTERLGYVYGGDPDPTR